MIRKIEIESGIWIEGYNYQKEEENAIYLLEENNNPSSVLEK